MIREKLVAHGVTNPGYVIYKIYVTSLVRFTPPSTTPLYGGALFGLRREGLARKTVCVYVCVCVCLYWTHLLLYTYFWIKKLSLWQIFWLRQHVTELFTSIWAPHPI